MTRPNALPPLQVTNMSAKLKLHCRFALARRHTVKQISCLASSGSPQRSMLLRVRSCTRIKLLSTTAANEVLAWEVRRLSNSKFK